MPRLFQTARTLGVASFLALTALPISAQSTDGFTGAYLAARSADANADFEALVEYGTRALAERPDNAGIMEGCWSRISVSDRSTKPFRWPGASSRCRGQ